MENMSKNAKLNVAIGAAWLAGLAAGYIAGAMFKSGHTGSGILHACFALGAMYCAYFAATKKEVKK